MSEQKIYVGAMRPPPYYKKYKDFPESGGPPPPAIPPKFTCFRMEHETDKLKLPWEYVLEEEKWKKITPSEAYDHSAELKKMTLSLLFEYSQLFKRLSQNPEKHEYALEKIKCLTQNLHATTNDFRPHQAREVLKSMMELQCERKQKQIEDAEAGYEHVEGMIKSCVDDIFPRSDKAKEEFKSLQIEMQNDCFLGGLHSGPSDVSFKRFKENIKENDFNDDIGKLLQNIAKNDM